MAILIKAVAGVGLCGAAIAFSPAAAATPFVTGGYAGIQGTAGETAPAAVAPGGAGAAAGRSGSRRRPGSRGDVYSACGCWRCNR